MSSPVKNNIAHGTSAHMHTLCKLIEPGLAFAVVAFGAAFAAGVGAAFVGGAEPADPRGIGPGTFTLQ
eukprot:2077386-Amphidinium_carterae.1